jgi:hypothetical protein
MKRWLLTMALLGVAASLVVWLLRPAPKDEAGARDPVARQILTSAATSTPSVPATVVPNPSPDQAPAPLSPSTTSPAGPRSTAATPAPQPPTAPASVSPAATVAAPAAGLQPQILLENMRTTMRQYGLMFGGNPVGTNLEITRALNGDNPKEVKFLGPDGNQLNEKGELVDGWGTPYFFHQLSAMEMEIRSAGPDRVLYTADDLVMK